MQVITSIKFLQPDFVLLYFNLLPSPRSSKLWNIRSLDWVLPLRAPGSSSRTSRNYQASRSAWTVPLRSWYRVRRCGVHLKGRKSVFLTKGGSLKISEIFDGNGQIHTCYGRGKLRHLCRAFSELQYIILKGLDHISSMRRVDPRLVPQNRLAQPWRIKRLTELEVIINYHNTLAGVYARWESKIPWPSETLRGSMPFQVPESRLLDPPQECGCYDARKFHNIYIYIYLRSKKEYTEL